MTALLRLLAVTIIITVFSRCSVIQKTSLQDIPEGKYMIPKTANKNFLKTDSLQPTGNIRFVYLFHENDSVLFRTSFHGSQLQVKGYMYPLKGKTEKIVLLKPSFDFDIFTTPFKYRPPVRDIPQQFNSNFNGSFYLGYRIDRFKLQQKEIYPGVIRESFNKNGIGMGGFIGVGTAFINPKFMNNTIDYEYDAFVIDYGIAVLFGIRNFSTGISVGFDFLTDKNRKNWVYQHKPWAGIFIGLNLN